MNFFCWWLDPTLFCDYFIFLFLFQICPLNTCVVFKREERPKHLALSLELIFRFLQSLGNTADTESQSLLFEWNLLLRC